MTYKRLFKGLIRMAAKYRHIINDDLESLAHITILECCRSWRSDGMKFDVFCIDRFLYKLKLRDHVCDHLKDAVNKSKGDKIQRLLDKYPEPGRSIAFERWIEGITVDELKVKYKMSAETITRTLDKIRIELLTTLEDSI